MKNIQVLTTLCLLCTSFATRAQVDNTRDRFLTTEVTAAFQPESAQAKHQPSQYGVTKRPEYPGGDTALMAYLNSAFRYPQVAVENALEGTVRIRFTVNKNGKAVDPRVIQSVHPVVDREVVKIILAMQDWNPGFENGQPVSSFVEIPFALALR